MLRRADLDSRGRSIQWVPGVYEHCCKYASPALICASVQSHESARVELARKSIPSLTLRAIRNA